MAGEPWSKQVTETKEVKQEVVNNTTLPQPSPTKVDGKVFEELLSKPQPLVEVEKGIDVLVFGDTNSGKTFFSMTCTEPVFVIDTEKRADKMRKYHYPGKDVRIFDPVVVKENYVDDEDAIDYPSSIDNVSNFLVALNSKIQKGEITKGTLVVDSLTDIWTWVQAWGKDRLAKKGRLDKDLLIPKNQFDWGLPIGKLSRLMTLFKHVTNKGIHFVGTARETNTPEYIEDKQVVARLPTDRIRVYKDVPFVFSSIINTKMQRVKTPTGFQTRYVAEVIKLDTLEYKKEAIENLNFEKLKTLISELAKETKGGV